MSTFLIFLLPIFVLGPLWFCLVVFRLWFPKHILKINQTLLLPIGILLFIATNSIQIYYFLLWIPHLCCGDGVYLEHVMSKLTEGTIQDHITRILFLLSFYYVPGVFTALIALILRKCWESTLKEQQTAMGSLTSLIGRKTSELLFSYMGQLTAYDPKTEELMVDVFTSDNYLYCGIYSDYFIDTDGKLLGVSITNAIRHRIAHSPDNGERVGNDAYIVPNQGEVFFPTEKINNFHVWKMKNDHLFSTHLKKEHHATVLAWYLAIQYVSKIKVRVKLLGEDFNKDMVKRFFNSLERLRIDIKQVKLEFEEDNSTVTKSE